MVRTGVHPLIATVFLIVLVVMAATLLSGWLQPFTESLTGAVDDEAERAQVCADTQLRIMDASFENGELTIAVMNTGFRTVDDARVTVLASGVVIESLEVESMESSDIASVTIETETADRIIAVSQACPMQLVEHDLS